jgi:hypothetical protein
MSWRSPIDNQADAFPFCTIRRRLTRERSATVHPTLVAISFARFRVMRVESPTVSQVMRFQAPLALVPLRLSQDPIYQRLASGTLAKRLGQEHESIVTL